MRNSQRQRQVFNRTTLTANSKILHHYNQYSHFSMLGVGVHLSRNYLLNRNETIATTNACHFFVDDF